MDVICLILWVAILIGVIVKIVIDRSLYAIFATGPIIIAIIHYLEKCFGV